MTDMLQELCIRYAKDFDLLFEHDTNPIDLFCKQRDAEQQRRLLSQLTEFHAGALAGRNSIRDLTSMGMEYIPADQRDTKI